jgi:hypothetical protein
MLIHPTFLRFLASSQFVGRRGDESRLVWRLWAQVAELVDAQASGACGGNLVEVRVFSWAPFSSSLIVSGENARCADLAPRLK